ncbi:hypothetical protein YPPY101_3007 [Yersinia pestis PY-101]|nr:hypothetical protein YPPY52_3134 [Yersinia pestis PY-52]EIT44583.1 hypothetical protein YPPY101_3007 [Yersinia pestis PY-101]
MIPSGALLPLAILSIRFYVFLNVKQVFHGVDGKCCVRLGAF